MNSFEDFRRKTLDYYDRNAHAYAHRTDPFIDRDAIRAFTSRLPSRAKILDVGCGTGRDLREFMSLGFAAEGVDGSAAMVELARRTGAPVRQEDFLFLRLPEASYDGIWAHRSLVHLPPAGCQRLLGQFFQSLKDRGTLFVSIEEAQASSPAPMDVPHEDRTDDPSGEPRYLYAYPRDEFASLLRQSGFRLLSEGRNLSRPSILAFVAERISIGN